MQELKKIQSILINSKEVVSWSSYKTLESINEILVESSYSVDDLQIDVDCEDAYIEGSGGEWYYENAKIPQ